MTQPGTCIPFQFEGRQLVDGALVDPIPIDILQDMGADILIGVDLSCIKKDRSPVTKNIFSIIYQSVDIMLENLNKASSINADIIIKPEYRGIFSYDIDLEERKNFIRLGEEETRKIIPALKELIASY